MPSTINTLIDKFTTSGNSCVQDALAVEEPLEIRISFVKDFQRIEKNISITMRTPGDDEELATGFLFTEGIIDNYDQIIDVSSPMNNVIVVTLAENVKFDLKKLERNFYTTSSCGICGKSSIDAINTIKNAKNNRSNLIVNASIINKLPSTLRSHQSVFEQTGGLHASAIFNNAGELILVKEDVGRHNALDKLIGSALKKKMLPLNNIILLLSGRASFELIQKAAMADICIVAAVGAPSSLAVELAKERNMTLIGFLKNDKFNIYCGKELISGIDFF